MIQVYNEQRAGLLVRQDLNKPALSAKDVIEKIQDCVPNVDKLVHQPEEQESTSGMEQSW